MRNNVSVCLHPDLVCDSHPHCDQAEDERITDRACYDKLLRKGRIREDATVLCMSKMYKSKYYLIYQFYFDTFLVFNCESNSSIYCHF